MPELTALQVLVTVARSPSLNAAAKALGVSQQAVSARVAGLESLVGVPLILRTRQGISMTKAGSTVAEWAHRLLDVAAELDSGLATLRDDGQAHIRIAASLTIAEHLLPGWLVGVRSPGRPNPEIQVVATNSDQVLELLRAGEVDLGFVEKPGVLTDVRSRTVARDELVVVVPPGHPWTRRGFVLDAHLLADTAIVSRETGSGTREALLHALRRVEGPGFRLRPALMSLSSTTAVRAAVAAGAGPAVLSRLAVDEDVRAGRLVEIPLPGVDLRRALRAAWVGGSAPPAGVARDLVAHLGSRRPTA
ncbi:LysR family transcriptional regulator [Nakamurella sp. YIM 132087]|uniref:LysR family transcriptional regulator n=2 Tax=Nakamurella alba TaxID=2665158 RepID=A0A7K1FHH0_9ACTN|nr:LysR family transcriptional regulator [Nakamurella alba]